MDAEKSDDRLLVPFLESAHRIGIARQTAYNWLNNGKYPIPVHRIHSKLVVKVCDIIAYVDGLGMPDEDVEVNAGAGSHQESGKASRRRGRPRLGT